MKERNLIQLETESFGGISPIVWRRRLLGECNVKGSYCQGSHAVNGTDLKENKGECCIPGKIQTCLLLLGVVLDSNQ